MVYLFICECYRSINTAPFAAACLCTRATFKGNRSRSRSFSGRRRPRRLWSRGSGRDRDAVLNAAFWMWRHMQPRSLHGLYGNPCNGRRRLHCAGDPGSPSATTTAIYNQTLSGWGRRTCCCSWILKLHCYLWISWPLGAQDFYLPLHRLCLEALFLKSYLIRDSIPEIFRIELFTLR